MGKLSTVLELPDNTAGSLQLQPRERCQNRLHLSPAEIRQKLFPAN